ncbi:MAG: ribonuclease Z [Solirubrobacteraceae bacterium]|jgi:ribonuclease Z
MELSVTFVGTAGSAPSARRGLPSLLVRYGAERILVDCGEGTQRQLIRSVGLVELTDVFITHLHLDHWLGLPGLLKSLDLRDRSRQLTLYGPPGIAAAMASMRKIYGRLGFRLDVIELQAQDTVRRGALEIQPVNVRHNTLTYGYVLAEDERPGRFDAELANALGVEFGPDFGRLQRGETVAGVTPEQVIGEPRPGRRLAISGDTGPCETLAIAAHGADLLIHEATFADEERERARLTGHSTAAQAARIALDAEVKLLALTHISARYGGGELRDEARAIFPDTELPRDFDAIEIPFAERGTPRLVRAGEAPAPTG